MEAVSFNSLSVAPNKLATRVSLKHDRCSLSKKRSLTCCQDGGNTIKLTILKERSAPVCADQSNAPIDSGSLVTSPNGKSQAESCEKDLVPYSGHSHSLVEMDDGIGIVRFFRGKRFFITGATGFLAKVLVEKILRTVPDVGKIFLLMKAKDKEAAMARLSSEIIKSELFESLQQTYGKSYEAFMLSKLIPVVGDVSESNLGLGDELVDFIANEVDIIVNSAATTKFDERYDIAIDINTKGPYHLMSFAKRCSQLKVLLQVSTAYVNGQRQGKIMEKPFCMGDSIVRESYGAEPPTSLPQLDVESEIHLALESKKALEDHAVAQKMKELGLNRAKKFGWQDTYTFTKAMGEMLIDDMRGEVPVIIIRPSVIESTIKEPFPGWMEGNRMMDPIILYYGKGQLTGFLVDPNGVIDVVPADMVVNATLAAIALHGMAGKSGTNIYQIASSAVNPLVFQDLARLLYEHYNTSPCIDSKGRPIPVPLMKLFTSMDEFLASLSGDGSQRSELRTMTASTKLSKKLEIVRRRLVEQAKKLANIYEPYTFYRGRFDNSNTERLMERMSEEEKTRFGFDVGSIDWTDYIINVHIPGLRWHVMKERRMCS